MANEAVTIELLGNGGDPIRYTVADANAIPKGTLMYLSADPRTMAISSAQGQFFCGIAASEKVANDGQTEIAVYTNGIFDLKATTAAITLGNYCKLGGANLIAAADEAGAQDAAQLVGKCLETVGNDEVTAVRILI